VIQQLRDYTGIAIDVLRLAGNVQPGTIQERILPGSLVGRYDARVSAPNGSALTVDHDPSLTAVSSSFGSTIGTYIPSTLKYRAGSAYVSFNPVIDRWDFSHGGRALPDTVPDLAAALLLNPSLKIMSMSGYYDLATPFYLTEIDLARLGKPQNVVIKNYHGGHMSYFDDSARRLQRTDLINFYGSATGGR
jgi:carboxypeptidase C (cathepsin A)